METNDVSIIRHLLEMDKKARELVEGAEQEKQKAEADLVEEKARVEAEILAKAQTRIARLKDQTAGETVKETRVIEDEGRQTLQSLEAAYAEHHTQWEDELFARCVAVK